MFMLDPTSGPGLGLRIRRQTVPVIIREQAVVEGSLMQFDLANTDAAVTDNAIDGGEQSGFANVVTPNSAEKDEEGGWFCLCTGVAAIADEQDVIVTGQNVKGMVIDVGAIALGDQLFNDVVDPDALTADFPSVGTGQKAIGIALFAGSPATAALSDVAFSGIAPLGHHHTD